MQLGVLAEDLGYQSLWVADHVMLGAEDAILEGWTTLAALAGMTSRARLGIIHYNNRLRHPAITAKMISSLDQISGGRMIHFVDFGNNARELRAYGLGTDDESDQARSQRITQMIEGLELTKALWDGNAPISFSGQHYATDSAVCAPKPVQRHIPIWMGEVWPGMLQATVRFADAWNSVPVSMALLAGRLEQLQVECAHAGRDYDSIEKTLEIQVLIAPTLDEVRRKLRVMLALVPDGENPDGALTAFLSGATDDLPDDLRETWWAGTPEQVRARANACIAMGFTHFMLWFVDAPDDSGMRLFAETIMPAWSGGILPAFGASRKL